MTSAMSPRLPFRQLLRDALSEALLASWNDVMPQVDKGLIHIEYESQEHQPIDWIRIFSSTTWGYWNLICTYSMHQQPLGSTGLSFGPGYQSATLSKSLERIMQHQQMFAPPETAQHGLIQVSPPSPPN